MMGGRINIRLVVAVLLVFLGSLVRGQEVSWIKGESAIAAWSIDPTSPAEADVISFSGPTDGYLNRCSAEQALGGQPTLGVYSKSKTIQLLFEPPASDDCGGVLEPVHGLQGSFGPLEEGQWTFFCNQSGVEFSIEFDVASDGPPPAIICVDVSAKGQEDGSSWANAFTDLQSALAVAVAGCEIRVAEGVYRPDRGPGVSEADPNAAFHLVKGVVLKGGYGGRRWPNPDKRDVVALETVLSGDLFGNDTPVACLCDMETDESRFDNSYHVVTTSAADSTTVLDGFTITGGTAVVPNQPNDIGSGGGIFNYDGSPVIRDCLIVGNVAAHYGGGVYTRGRTGLTLIDCTITGNWAGWWGGGVCNAWNGGLVMTRCVVSGNGVQYLGGGIYSHIDSQVDVSNCLISGNMALNPDTGRGGGVFSYQAVIDLSCCTFVGNRAALGSTLACDSAGGSDGGEIHVSSSILWNEGTIVSNDDGSLLEILYSDVQGGWPGKGNINADPCFVQTGYWDYGKDQTDSADDTWFDGDYHLLWDSPCLDAGDPALVPDEDVTDLDGTDRLSGLAVDMGVYEVRNDPPVTDAVPDATGYSLDGKGGDVTLDASGAYDPEGSSLSYRWYLNGELVSNEVRFTIELPLGTHILELVVSDSIGVSATEEVVARVVMPVDTEALVSPSSVSHRDTSDPITALVLLPRGKRVSDFDNSHRLVLYPGAIEATGQFPFLWLNGNAVVLAKFKTADLFAAVPTYGQIQLRIIGRLKDGTYFSGNDTITLK